MVSVSALYLYGYPLNVFTTNFKVSTENLQILLNKIFVKKKIGKFFIFTYDLTEKSYVFFLV